MLISNIITELFYNDKLIKVQASLKTKFIISNLKLYFKVGRC